MKTCLSLSLLLALFLSPHRLQAADATKEKPFENSLGMKFVPVPGTKVLFGVWVTRVKDFEAFVKATEYDATQNVFSLGEDGWKKHGASWKQPGFKQEAEHPVVGVSWDDAQAFCKWLTKKERDAGLIGENQSYRLPTDLEWSEAAGKTKYTWGNDFPPPAWSAHDNVTRKMTDYSYTSRVDRDKGNEYGLCDMGGNVQQWCEDFFRIDMNEKEILTKFPNLNFDGGGKQFLVVRGNSWFATLDPVFLLSSRRCPGGPEYRNTSFGFRCVLTYDTAKSP